MRNVESLQICPDPSASEAGRLLDRVPENHAREPLYQKSAGDIGSSHILELQTLEEGWFVEFKEQLPDTSKFARSISSFANSHGGLLVIGAKEEQKTRRLASFTPMSRENADKCILRAREAVAAHVSPPIFFEAKAVELDELVSDMYERWIVVISIPKGSRGPYLHSNGCIYVRVGDAATPYPLSDLTQQERLWTESLNRKKQLRNRVEWLSDQFRQGTPSIHVFILADDIVANAKQCTHHDFREIAFAEHVETADPIFDQVQTLDTSFVARRTEQLIEASGLLWDYDYQRSLHFIQIPIATHIWNGKEFDNRADQFGLFELAERLKSREVSSEIMITNLLPMLYFLCIMVRKVQMLHRRQSYGGNLKLNACVVDARATIPFLGTPSYLNEIDCTNFPYIHRDIGFIRPLEDSSSWFNFSVEPTVSDIDSMMKINIAESFSVFSEIAQSMGISRHLSLGISEHREENQEFHLANLFATLVGRSFSFQSQSNPKAKR